MAENLALSRGRDIPQAVIVLGGAGILPLAASVVIAWAAPYVFGVPVVRAAVLYGVLVLSFLGGVYWGLGSAALVLDRTRFHAPRVIGWSALPVLMGWFTALVPGSLGPVALAISFFLMLLLDRVSTASGTPPVGGGGSEWD